jgi:ribosomal-protein-alanine N-acetyltransferase
MKQTDDITLKILTADDVSQAYVDWLLDPRVTAYSENTYRAFSLEGQKKYVADASKDHAVRLYGIFDAAQKHIGNVALNNINLNHMNAEVTFMIGDPDHWGRGLASHAVGEAVSIAQNELGLRKVYAGCASLNEGSKRVLVKNGFELEGCRKNQLCYGGVWMDQLEYGRTF